MKEKDIRKPSLMQENEELHKADVRQLLKYKNKFLLVDCPACQVNKANLWINKGGFTFVKCVKCETYYVNPRPSFKSLINFYATSLSIKHWNDKIFPASAAARRKYIFRPRASRVAKLCNKYQVKFNLLLDVGAGDGTFVEEISKLKLFKDVVAVEPAKAQAETCRQKKLTVIEKPIEEIKLKKANVITNFELIEHLFSPIKFLRACSKILVRGGLLILTTPNIKGFDMLLLGRNSDHITAPNHLNYFHSKSIEMLVKQCGFKVLEILTPGKLDAEIVRKKAKAGKFNISQHPFIKQVLLERWEDLGNKFQAFLAKNQLSSHMWVVAKKT